MGTISQVPKAFKELHEILSTHSDNPGEHLEAIADEALRDGCLNDMQYDVLKHRFPFPDVEREFLRELTKRLDNSYAAVNLLEGRAYKNVKGYLYRFYGEQETPGMDIGFLPWKKLYGNVGLSTASNLVGNIGHETVTVGDVVELFENHASVNKILVIPYFGPKKLEIVYAIFEEVGVKLPKVRVT